MKLTFSLLLSTLCWSARLSSAATAQIYVHNSKSQPRSDVEHQQLSPPQARLVLAQRAGVEAYHEDGAPDEDTLKAINNFGARTPIFAEATKQPRRVFWLVEAESMGDVPNTLGSYLTISPPPSMNSTRDLFVDLAKQVLRKESIEGVDAKLEESLRGGAQRWDGYGYEFVVGGISSRFGDALGAIMDTDDDYDDIQLTILHIPSDSATRGAITDSEWGTYEMPSSHSLLRKRQSKEAPLEEDETGKTLAPVESSTSPSFGIADSSPLPGILPACFTSLSACQSATRNCSSHGTCAKKYTDKTAEDSSPYANCYTCQCTATTTEDSDLGGILTTYWGGPACQKKDISIQFWLLALFTIAMVGLVSFAVGQVWSMGDEELPSVIGAGVSGPVKR